MYRNNNLNACSQDVRGGTFLNPCTAPTTPITSADTLTTSTGVSSGTTTTNTLCPIHWGDNLNNGVWANFCNWKQSFKATFLGKPYPCNFLEKRRVVLQDKLNGMVTAGTHPLWQHQIVMKLGFIQFLGFNYGCYTSAPTNTPQARISAQPEIMQRQSRRKQNLVGMKNVNRNIYNI